LQSTSSQQGFGLDADFITRITKLVTAQIKRDNAEETQSRPVVSNYKYYDRSDPVVTSEVKTVQPDQPQRFSTEVFQNDLNDSFDHKRLLKQVPKRFHEKAKHLINALDDRANELTWDSSGLQSNKINFYLMKVYLDANV